MVMATKTVTVTTNSFIGLGRHIYVTLQSDDKLAEYKARNSLDARRFIERMLTEEFAGHEVTEAGDTPVFFVYARDGD